MVERAAIADDSIGELPMADAQKMLSTTDRGALKDAWLGMHKYNDKPSGDHGPRFSTLALGTAHSIRDKIKERHRHVDE
jgi:hypothetical protein